MFEDGPLELPDRTLWFKNGNLHRTDGPAVEFNTGLKFWFLNGNAVTEQDVLAYRQDIERRALELSDKLKSQYDTSLDHDISVGHAIPLKNASHKE
jgi:IS5 family transposase